MTSTSSSIFSFWS